MALVYITVIVVGLLWTGLIASIAPDDADGNLTNTGRGCVLVVGLLPVIAVVWWIAANGPY